MPTKVEILFEHEIDKGRLDKLLKDHIISDKPVLDYSISLVNDSGEPLSLSTEDIMQLSIYTLPLKNRTIGVLVNAHMNNRNGVCERRSDKDVTTVAELARKNARELLKYFEFGQAALKDVRQALAKFGLSLEGEQDSLPL